MRRDALLEAASSATGLSDFGNRDFEEGFSVLLQAYADDAQLTPLGEQLVRDEIVGDPPHLRCVKELFAEFPEACIIQTHRDPARVVPSYASLIAHFSSVYEENIDRAAIGRLSAKLWDDRIARGMEDRAVLGRESQFFDLHFRDVLTDPVGSIRKALSAFEMELSEKTIDRMETWNRSHKPGRHGAHDYSAETFGLDAAELSERFRLYRERFGVPEE